MSLLRLSRRQPSINRLITATTPMIDIISIAIDIHSDHIITTTRPIELQTC